MVAPKGLLLFLAVVVIVGAVLVLSRPVGQPEVFDGAITGTDTLTDDGTGMAGDGETVEGYDGRVLAGSDALVLDFTSADYEKALASDKLIVLFFYADWCPNCRAEMPKMYEAFVSWGADDVIGFRVNYNDPSTDDAERELAREHGIAYQHTKVFILDGERILKSPETWETERYISEMSAVLR